MLRNTVEEEIRLHQREQDGKRSMTVVMLKL